MVRTRLKTHSPSVPCIYPKFAWLYAEKGGGPVLKGSLAFWKINGFLYHNNKGHYTVTFRRHWS